MIQDPQIRPALEATLGFIKSRDGEENTFTPSKERYFYAFPSPSREKLRSIAENALQAQWDWEALSLRKRRLYFETLYNVIEKNLDEIIEVIQQDTGKPRQEVLVHEVIPVLDALKAYPKIAKKALQPRYRRSHLLPTQRIVVRQVPFKLVGLICPWNFPFFLSAHAIIQAMVAGNAVVFKPSENTPLTGLLIQTLFNRAKFPENIINTIFGDGIVGQSMVLEPQIKKIGFIGSTHTGKHILKLAADRVLPVSLELGGKDALLVTHDADLDLAAKGAVISAFSNAGQACTSSERIYVDRRILDAFTQNFVEQTKKLSEEGQVGPMVTGQQVGIIQEQLEDAKEKGAQVLVGGDIERRRVSPTILTQVTREMLVLQEETFGPIAPIIPFDNEEDAIKEINDSPYGLSGAIFCGDRQRAIALAEKFETGHVMINSALTSPSITEAPWGGVKESGLGRSNGVEGIRAQCQLQSIVVDQWPPLWRWMGFPYTQKKWTWLMRLVRLFRYLPVL